jgi:hypothetical protein
MDFSMLFAIKHCNKTQTLQGITSLIPNSKDKHIIMIDSKSNCNLHLLTEKLKDIQEKYNLSNVGIFSDKEGSYRVWCFTQVYFVTLLRILLDVYDFLDYNFFYWTVVKGKATLRTNSKKNRPRQELVSFLMSYPVPIPEKCEKVIYDTGVEKRGLSILLGEGGKIIRGDSNA